MKLSSDLSAIVTGGASGLGEATARRLSAAGVKTALFDLNAKRGESVAGEIGGLFCECDVTKDDSVAAAFDKARQAHGKARILVNCAGTGLGIKTAGRKKDTGEVQGHPIDYFAKIIEINLIGTFRCMVAASVDFLSLDPANEDGERGVIVNTASIAAQDGQVGQVAYSASKGGILGLTLPAARDLASEGVRVVTIMPGLFDTPLMLAAPDKLRDSLLAQVPFPHRMGKPDEFGALVQHICENPMLNGESIRLDAATRFQPR